VKKVAVLLALRALYLDLLTTSKSYLLTIKSSRQTQTRSSTNPIW